MLCYVDHHDNAYHWAERRKLETHPKTGAAQLVEVRETVRAITVPCMWRLSSRCHPSHPCSQNTADSDLLGYGVPPSG